MVDIIDSKKSFNLLSIDGIYKSNLTILSTKERRRLAIIKELFSNPEIAISSIFIKQNRVDTFSYVNEGGQPAYHSDSNCEFLHADLRTHEIPDEIKNIPNREEKIKKVVEYRKWFKLHKHMLDTKEGTEKFLFERFHHFNLKNVNEMLVKHEKNSGVTAVENINLETLERDIDALINAATKFKLEPKNRDVIIDYGDDSKIKLSDNTRQEILNKWHDYKSRLKSMMVDYFMVKFNPELNFSLTLLEQLGFKYCQRCADAAQRVEFTDDLPF